jgi:hypothetical protein
MKTRRPPRPSWPRIARALALAAFAAPAGLRAPTAAAPAEDPGSVVAVVAEPGSRLADDIARELATSSFTVVKQTRRGGELDPAPPRPDGRTPSLAVVVAPDDLHVLVFARAPGGLVQRYDLPVAAGDRVARRRACLLVVEHLRSLTAAADLREPVLSEPGPPPAHTTAGAPAAAVAAAAANPRERPPRPWALGAASTINFDAAVGAPTSHVLLLAATPLGDRWHGWARADWPVLGAQLPSEGAHVRLWTFGAAAGAHLHLRSRAARLRPYVGGAAGTRLVLSDTHRLEGRTDVALTPAASLGAQIGLRYGLAPGADVFCHVELADAVALWASGRASYDRAVAGARAAHAAIGVLFDR